MGESEPWLGVEQIAAHLSVSKETIYRWLEKKRIPSYRLGKVWRFRASEVDEWLRNGDAAEAPTKTSAKDMEFKS